MIQSYASKGRMLKEVFMYVVLAVLLISCENDNKRAQDYLNDLGTENMDLHPDTANEGEMHRPKFHFTPLANWMNDPNGMVYYEGEYHLFYQYYPDDIVWGPMHWGHAVSTDLVSWEHLPIALYPDELGYIFSGSAVVDWNNSSGFGKNGIPPLVAIFTYHDPVKEKAKTIDVETQGIAYSLDKGRTWTKFEGNPVIANPGIRDFRDPKVVWYEPQNKWVMVLAAQDQVRFYDSKDLKKWNYLSDFGKRLGAHGGVWECPDLFPIQVKDTKETKWVLIQSINPGGPNGGSATQYFVGDFNGQQFELDKKFEADVSPSPSKVPAGRVFADFESMSYDVWEKEGFAMGNGPVKKSVVSDQSVDGYEGERLVNSFFGGDGPTGKLISPTFVIESSFINFKIGGGNHPGQTGMDLIVDNEVVASATGDDSNTLRWHSWDVKKYKGKSAKMVIYDQVDTDWGFILIDQITFAEDVASAAKEQAVWLDYGMDNYAGVTWSDTRMPADQRIFMGWMSNWLYAQNVPTKNWRSAMTIPRILELHKMEKGYRILAQPVPNQKSLRKEMKQIVEPVLNKMIDFDWVNGKVIGEVECIFDVSTAQNANVGIALQNENGDQVLIGFDRKLNQYYMDKRDVKNHDFNANFAKKVSWAPATESANGRIRFHLILDVSSVELFAEDGKVVMTEIFFPTNDFSSINTFSTEEAVEIIDLKVYQY